MATDPTNAITTPFSAVQPVHGAALRSSSNAIVWDNPADFKSLGGDGAHHQRRLHRRRDPRGLRPARRAGPLAGRRLRRRRARVHARHVREHPRHLELLGDGPVLVRPRPRRLGQSRPTSASTGGTTSAGAICSATSRSAARRSAIYVAAGNLRDVGNVIAQGALELRADAVLHLLPRRHRRAARRAPRSKRRTFGRRVDPRDPRVGTSSIRGLPEYL